jgi:hypothetical protein
MISTSRGLSAVRPGDDSDAGPGLWQGRQRRAVAVGPEPVHAKDGHGHDGGHQARPRGRRVRAREALQLPVDVAGEAEGTASTATTSKLAV